MSDIKPIHVGELYRTPEAGERYYGSGEKFDIICVVTTKEDDSPKFLIYQDDKDGKYWAMKLSEFNAILSDEHGRLWKRYELCD